MTLLEKARPDTAAPVLRKEDSRTQNTINSMPPYVQRHVQKYAVMPNRLAACCLQYRKTNSTEAVSK
jgi:hypothetical protein